MTRRRATLLAVLLPAVVVGAAACSGSGHPKAAATTSHSAQNSAASLLASQLAASLDSLTSVHVDVTAGALIPSLTGQVALSHGNAVASQIAIGSGSSEIDVITVATASWAKPPADQNTGGKPWLPVTADSSNEVVRGLGSSLDLVKAASSLGQLATLAGTAQHLTKTGNAYTFDVTGTKSGGTPLQQTLGEFSTKPIPVALTLDAQRRPTTVTFEVAFAGSTIPVKVALSQFDAPVSIAKPPADEIGS